MSAADDFETADAPLCPNKADIAAHLYALFPSAFVHPHHDARIEIAYGHSDTKGGAITEARNFSAFELKEAAEFAEVKNRAGFNIYVGPALRQGKQPGDGRAKDKDVLASAYAWAEFDGAGDDERIDAILKTHRLVPAMIVTTGRVPHRRAHLYFQLDCSANAETVSGINASLKKMLGSDAVQNASRLMRLAGTINYPPPKKIERGYVAELVTLHIRKDAPAYTVGLLMRLAGKMSSSFGFDTHTARNDSELNALLEASREPGKWHNSMRAAIATMIGRGWSDTAIKLSCAPYCRGGADDPDLVPLIEGGRKKWNRPDEESVAAGADAANGGPDNDQAADEASEAREDDERVANQAPIAQTLPVIKVHPRISQLTNEAQQMRIAARVPFYQRGGELVRPIIRTVKAAHGHLTRTAQLKPIHPVYLRDTMCRHALWVKFDARKGDWVPTIAPMNVAETLLARDGVWSFAEIVGVIACPTMRPDGSLLVKQGYDPTTRLILIEPPAMPPILDQPTHDDALRALALLEDLVCESPFEDEASKSVALSGLITPVVRGAMPVVPMHASSAPTAGTGKSFLWDLTAAISIGQRRIPVIAAGSEEETEKRLGSILMTGQPLISIDNVNGQLKGEFLAQAIEQHFLDIRPLGVSRIVRVEAGSTTIFCTGNNITIAGADLCRRTIIARLDAQLEKPQLRQFKYNPIKAILDDRGKYIAAALTICRAYVVADRPGVLPRLASFEAWSDTVRSALVWLGKADPLDTMDDIRADDPERELLGQVLRAWEKDHGVGPGSDVPLTVIVDRATKTQPGVGFDPTPEPVFPELNAAVRTAAGATGNAKIDILKLGLWCRANKGRIVDGLRLKNKESKRGGAARWWVERK